MTGIQSLENLGQSLGPYNLLIGGGAAAIVIAYLTFISVWSREDKRALEAPGPRPEFEIRYAPKLEIGGIRLPALVSSVVAIAVVLLEAWDFQRGAFDLRSLAFLGLPLLAVLVLHERRILRSRPAVAAFPGGLKLDTWRGVISVPWKDIEYVRASYDEAARYRWNLEFCLCIGRKDGRVWRYSEHDFGDDAQSHFETICDVAQRYIPEPLP